MNSGWVQLPVRQLRVPPVRGSLSRWPRLPQERATGPGAGALSCGSAERASPADRVSSPAAVTALRICCNCEQCVCRSLSSDRKSARAC